MSEIRPLVFGDYAVSCYVLRLIKGQADTEASLSIFLFLSVYSVPCENLIESFRWDFGECQREVRVTKRVRKGK